MSMKQDNSSKNLIIKSYIFTNTMVHKIKLCPGLFTSVVTNTSYRKFFFKFSNIAPFQNANNNILFKSVGRNIWYEMCWEFFLKINFLYF
jgi:hypothetical protein